MGEAAADRRGRRGRLGVTRATVRDATFDVFRRRGLTTLFSNPGSTEVPFLAGLPDDLRFVLGAARGLGRRARDRLRARPRRAGARAAAHDGRARQRGRRDRDRARQPRAARGRRRPAGPPPPRVRAVPRRPAARARGRVPGLGRPAGARAGRSGRDRPRLARGGDARAGPALVIVPMDDWLQPADDEREDAAPGAGRPRGRASTRPRSTSSRRSSRVRRRRRSWSVPARTTRRRGRRSSSWPSGSSRRSSRSRSARAPASRRTTASSPASCRPTGPRLRETARAVRRGARRRRARVPAVAVGAGPAHRARDADRGRRRRPGRGAPQPRRARRARAAGRGLRASSRAGCRSATREPPDAVRRRRPRPTPPAPGEPLTREPRARGARRAAPRGRRAGRGGARRPARAARPPARARGRSASSAPRWAGSASPSPARPASGWRCRSGRWSRSSATARRSTGSRALWSAAQERAGVLYVILSNGGYAIMDRLAERHGGDAPWPGFGDVDIAAIARGFGCEARRIETHDELLAALDEALPTLASRDGAAAARRRDRADGALRAVRGGRPRGALPRSAYLTTNVRFSDGARARAEGVRPAPEPHLPGARGRCP